MQIGVKFLAMRQMSLCQQSLYSKRKTLHGFLSYGIISPIIYHMEQQIVTYFLFAHSAVIPKT